MYGRLLFIFAIFVLSACQGDKTAPTTEPEEEKKPVTVPRFDRDSAFAFVQKQTEFGPRVPNTEAHRQTRAWLVERFKTFGAEVIEQNFDATIYTGEVYKSTNIIAQYNTNASKRVILAAHWDCRHTADHDPSEENHDEPVMGADDGASGVGVLLEIARQIQQNPIDIGIDIILFDAEDNGDGGDQGKPEGWCLGSQYWSRNPHKKGYDAKYG
ncbi:MAG: M28 family peptidase, partial [Bacteroidota bacterium]